MQGEPAGGFPGSAKDGEEDKDSAAFFHRQGLAPISLVETAPHGCDFDGAIAGSQNLQLALWSGERWGGQPTFHPHLCH